MVAGINGVQMGPGATLFTRMPFSPSIWARLAHRLAIAALVAAYGASWGLGWSDCTEELPMIEEPSRMCGTAALQRWNIADRFVAMVKSHSSSGISSRDSRVIWYAALLTR